MNGLGNAERTKIQAVGPGSNFGSAIYFYDFTDIPEIPTVPLAEWVGQQGNEALRTGSNPSLYLNKFSNQ